jgi:hypothetical protein
VAVVGVGFVIAGAILASRRETRPAVKIDQAAT